MTPTKAKEIDKIITKMIKGSAKIATNKADCRLWARVEEGGWGLTSLQHANNTQLVSNMVNNAWNTRDNHPGNLIETEWKKETGGRNEGPLGQMIRGAIAAFPGKLIERSGGKKPRELKTISTTKTDRYLDRKKTRWILPIWTDGGKTEKKASCAKVRGRGRETHKSWQAVKSTLSTASELEAIEEAMRIKAEVPMVIFTDSKAATRAIGNRPDREREWRKNENATIVERIRSLVVERIRRNWGVPEILWIPEYTDEDKETEKKERARKQLGELYKRFDADQLQNKLVYSVLIFVAPVPVWYSPCEHPFTFQHYLPYIYDW
jgi:hypothetical protein